VDANGDLHLNIQYDATLDAYTCASLKTTVLGCGTYTFTVNGGFPDDDANVVLGLFTYSDESAYDWHEIDIEMSRFGDAQGENLGYTTWDNGSSTSDEYFTDLSVDTEHRIIWNPDGILFQSFVDGVQITNGGSRDEEDTYPCTGQSMTARINFWLFQGNDAQQDYEIVIDDFTYEPFQSVLQPEQFGATLNASNEAELSWSDYSIGGPDYIVERDLNSAGFSSLATITTGATSYTDSTVQAGDVAYYRVKSCIGSVCSLVSNADSVTVPGQDTDTDTGTTMTLTSINKSMTGSSGYVSGTISGYSGSWHARTWIYVNNDYVYTQSSDLSIDANGYFYAQGLWGTPRPYKSIYVTLHPSSTDQFGTNTQGQTVDVDTWDAGTFLNQDVLIFGPFPTL
jgi:hypothetical protein